MQARTKSSAVGHAVGQQRLAEAHRPSRVAHPRHPSVVALVTVLAVLAGCQPNEVPRAGGYHARGPGYSAQPIESADGLGEGFSPGSPGSATEPDIPLPPGWAEELAHLREIQASAKSSSQDSRAELIDGSPDRNARPSVDQDARDAEALLGGYGPYREHGPDDRRVGRLGSSNRPPPRRPMRPPSSAGDYTIMAIVFLAPLVLLIPLLWFWHLACTLRSTPDSQIVPGPVRHMS